MTELRIEESTGNVDKLQKETDAALAAYKGPRGAGFWIRAPARAIDTAIGLLVGFMAPILAVIILAILRTRGSPHDWVHSFRFSLGGLIVSMWGAIGYHTIGEYLGGASLGKLLCGLRVVRQYLARATVANTAVRNMAYIPDGFSLGGIAAITMASSPARQRLGDRWGHTLVLRRQDVPANVLYSGGEIAVGVLTGFFCWTGFVVLKYIGAIL